MIFLKLLIFSIVVILNLFTDGSTLGICPKEVQNMAKALSVSTSDSIPCLVNTGSNLRNHQVGTD